MQYKIENDWLQGVTEVPSPFYNDRPESDTISLLVIHNISLPPNQYGGPYVQQLFTGKLDPNAHPYFKAIYQLQVSSHLFIRRDGEVLQFVPFNKRAWHAGQSVFNGRDNCNDFSIGIEMEGCDTDTFTEIQYQTLAAITTVLIDHYKIADITGHSDIAPQRKTDPGPYFDWAHYLSLIDNRILKMTHHDYEPVTQQLIKITKELQLCELWQSVPPPTDAFLSEQPFALDTMQPHEWLQWIFIPRMRALVAAKKSLPRGFALHPYFEEAFKEQQQIHNLLLLIKQLDELASA